MSLLPSVLGLLLLQLFVDNVGNFLRCLDFGYFHAFALLPPHAPMLSSPTLLLALFAALS